MAKNVQRESKFPGLMDGLKPTHTPTHTHTHTHDDTPNPVAEKKTKNMRVSLLMNKSVRDWLDAYGVSKGISRNDLIHKLATEFMNNEEMRSRFEEKYLKDEV